MEVIISVVTLLCLINEAFIPGFLPVLRACAIFASLISASQYEIDLRGR